MSNQPREGQLKAWVFLVIAIAAEVIATLSLKAFSPLVGYVMMGVFIILSYYFMGLCVRTIPIGTAYAMWEVLGLVLIVGFGIVVFDEVPNFYQKLGIALGIIGIILINLGEKKESEKK
ncbi:multidrug efflux SMR transporter [Helicobacter sp. 11S02596-1]|uniref:DMT family transporter n=1 Tax=Helicobacter sp. 11S02596-1 TaxID=1476194 RepID=UPI000BA63DFD|nr:multidrug efflux SMR transporter [Helicobacter sp. 11S02596-1]PAF45230.1 hypothetical protein BJI48_01340 [Helicobacter sp. 11S02596-1]